MPSFTYFVLYPMVNNGTHWWLHGIAMGYILPDREGVLNNTHRKMVSYPLFDLYPTQYRNVRMEHVGYRDQQRPFCYR